MDITTIAQVEEQPDIRLAALRADLESMNAGVVTLLEARAPRAKWGATIEGPDGILVGATFTCRGLAIQIAEELGPKHQCNFRLHPPAGFI